MSAFAETHDHFAGSNKLFISVWVWLLLLTSFEVFRGTVQAVDIGPTAVYSIAILLANIALGVLYMRVTGRVTA